MVGSDKVTGERRKIGSPKDLALAARERDEAFAQVSARIAEKGLTLQKLPDGYSRVRWGMLSEEERRRQDTGIRVVCWSELYEIPKGSVGKVLGYDPRNLDVDIEWITVKHAKEDPIIDGFSPDEFLDSLAVLSKQEYEQYAKALKPSARG